MSKAVVKKNLDLMESMIYYWKATSEKEKVGEKFICSISEHPSMRYSYSDDFTEDSVRAVLSAISNREILSPGSQNQGRFWNNNMWMLEDLSITDMMLAPIKTLNIDEISESLPDDLEYEVVFIPGHVDTFYADKSSNKLLINFFKLMTDFNTAEVTIEGVSLVEFIKDKLREMSK
jgi:hypothetical protein